MHRLARLSLREYAVLAGTVTLLIALRFSLWLLPWHRAVTAIGFLSRMIPSTRLSAERLERLVYRASAIVPCTTCLPRALALHLLLSASGHATTFQIGVARDLQRGFIAHAWVERDGVPLFSSAGEVARYGRILTIEGPMRDRLMATRLDLIR